MPALRAALVLLATGLLAPLALAQKHYGPGVSDTEIKLGQSYPYSGPLSAYSNIAKTEVAYFAKVNAEGGVNGRKVNLASLDDGFQPPKTVENVRRLVEADQVLALFQVLGTPTNTAILKYVNAKQVPNLFVATGATKFGDREVSPWTIGWQPTYHVEMAVFARYIMKNFPDAKVGVLYQNDDSGRDFLQGIHDGFGDARKKFVIAEISYEATDPTVDSQIISLRGAGADTFIISTAPKAAAQALRKAATIGWKPRMFLTQISSSVESVLKPAGFDSAIGVISTGFIKDPSDPQWKDDPAVKDYLAFMRQYRADGDPLETFNVYGYTVAQTMVEVLKACGDNLTRENLMRVATEMKPMSLPMLLPGITVSTSATDRYPIKQEQLMRFDGQKWVRFGEIISGR